MAMRSEALKDRLHLLEQNHWVLGETYRDARQRGVTGPLVLFLVDARDEQGPEFWRAFRGGGSLVGFEAMLPAGKFRP